MTSTLIATFDPSAKTQDTFTTGLGKDAGTILALNDSAVTIYFQYADGSRHLLPAQIWRKFDVPAGNAQMAWAQDTILPLSVPNSLVYCEVLTEADQTSEAFPAALVRGTKSTGALMVTTLSNEGNGAGTLVVDMGPASNPDVTEIWNDHFNIGVVQSGVAHTALQGQISGNPLLLGELGDITEVLGSLLADQILAVGVARSNSHAQFQYNDSTGSLIMFPPVAGAFPTGLAFVCWTGATQLTVLSVGGAFNSAASWFGSAGNLGQIAGQATVGSFGVAPFVAQALDVNVATTALTTVLTYTPPAKQKLRINATFAANNGGTNQPTLIFSFTGASYNLPATFNMALNNGVLLDGTHTVTAGLDFACTSEVFSAQANAAVTCKYQNSTGAPNDFVSFMIERVA